MRIDPSSRYAMLMDWWERSILTIALLDHGWNVQAAAHTLGIDRKTLERRMAVLGIRPPEKHGGGEGEHGISHGDM